MKKEILENLRMRLLQVYLEENREVLLSARQNAVILKGGELKNET